ncbi:MAG: helix-turn-helix domain-containing protein [Clostridia bacterium]|nr:helix-turn-helix domain-containing protein [Clostridia bacterium]
MSNRLYQGIIHQMKDAVGRTVGVIDENGLVVACSELTKIGESRQNVRELVRFSSNAVVSDNYTYMVLGTSSRNDCIVFVEGGDPLAEKLAAILAVSLNNIRNFYDEKHDKVTFMKNIILDNIMPGDIYLKAKELHFATDVLRYAMLIRFPENCDAVPYDTVSNMFPNSSQDYVISVDESNVAVIREIKPGSEAEMEKTAKTVSDTLLAETFTQVYIGIGNPVSSVKDVARSYREAQASLEVGRVFDKDKTIVSYDKLGIGRLIYQLPVTLCEMFLSEVFTKSSVELLDRETMATVKCFFENNLNISETSRKMFVHRNTLVYRLDKIKRITGLDLREFDNAITFEVALMVKKYLDSKPMRF